MFALGIAVKAIVCAKLLLALGYFILRSEHSGEPSSKQLYPSRISLDLHIDSTDEELLDITQQIWEADDKRMKDTQVKYEYRRGKKFFVQMNKNAWKGKPTYAKLNDLFYNYQAFTGTNMSRDRDLLDKENDFLDAILETEPIKVLYNWLVRRGLPTPETFKKDLHQYWFATYNRSGVVSSGFRHTFVGEIYGGEVNGFHNWVRMYKEDQAGRLQVTDRFSVSCCEPPIEAIAFDWTPINSQRTFHKDVSSLFIRSSPEVEIALYTFCLLKHPNDCCLIRLKTNNIVYSRSITTYERQNLPFKTIDSAFPSCTCTK